MRKILIIVILSVACFQIQAQEINQIMVDPDLDREILIGLVDEKGLSQSIFVEDWEDRVDIYYPDKVATKNLKKYLKKNKDVYILVFFASWCGDSEEHMPDFVKLSKEVKMRNVVYYALNREKTMPNMQKEKYEIEFVPTFVVYRGAHEIGRIVESPELSLEKDLWKIMSEN